VAQVVRICRLIYNLVPMPEPLIEFHCQTGLAGQPFPQPRPAVQDTPLWLKQMPASMAAGDGQTLLTVKKCVPFLDAVTSGYIIPLVADVHFRMGEKSLEYQSDLPIIERHPLAQLQGTPFQGLPVVKFLNPWIVKTPPGYSCFFTQPVNRLDVPFYILSGVVETDSYYNEINFPSVAMMRPGSSVTLKKGTPIAQILPFRRENWHSQCAATDEALRQPWKSLGTEPGRYKDNMWRRKSYG
jgi:hypothetical protein